MPRGVPISENEEATIKAAVTARPHALLVARESRGAWSYATVWRVADRAGIALTAELVADRKPLAAHAARIDGGIDGLGER
jgi:hypothetical protein